MLQESAAVVVTELTSTLCVPAETSPQVIQSASINCQSFEDAAVAQSQIASPIRPWKSIGRRPNLSDSAPTRGETRAIVKLPIVQSTVLQKLRVVMSCLQRSSSLPVLAVPVRPNCIAHCGGHDDQEGRGAAHSDVRVSSAGQSPASMTGAMDRRWASDSNDRDPPTLSASSG